MIKVYALVCKGKAKWQVMRDNSGILKIYASEEKAKEAANGYVGGEVKVKEMLLRTQC